MRNPAEAPAAALHLDTAKLPHLCFVAPTAWPVVSGDRNIELVGGAEVQQSILARLFARAGYRVSMICLDYGQAPRTVINGITVYKTHPPDSGLPMLRFIHPRLSSTWRVMGDIDADIYYQRAAGMLTAVVAAFCRYRGKKSIYAGASDHDFIPGRQDIRYRRDRWLFEQGLKMVDRRVVQNEIQQRYCLDYYGLPATIIPSCYELPPRRSIGIASDVLWVGTLRRNKRPELFLELAGRLPQYRFVMVGGPDGGPGDADYFAAIRRRAQALPNVEFTGFLPLDRVETHFERAAIFVNTSTHEGMPNTFLQAWARGIPTIALIDTGARLDDSPLYLVAKDVEAVAGEVERLFSDDIYRRRSAERCLRYFSNTHGPDGVLARYSQLFDELTGAERHG